MTRTETVLEGLMDVLTDPAVEAERERKAAYVVDVLTDSEPDSDEDDEAASETASTRHTRRINMMLETGERLIGEHQRSKAAA